jgi:Sec-independent protein secretion pathway component TatC
MKDTRDSCNMVWFGFMVLNATFSNISVISWQSFLLPLSLYYTVGVLTYHIWGGRGRDRMVVGFTTTCAINAHHH